MFGFPFAAVADPDSAFFSQQVETHQVRQQQSAWQYSEVNVPQLCATGNPETSSVNLGGVSAGQGGAMAGIGAGMQGVNAALPATLRVLGVGTGNSLAGGSGGGGGGVSPGAVGAAATTGALGAVLGFGR